MGLGKRCIVGPERTIDFVGADVVKTKRRSRGFIEATPVRARRLEQAEGSLDVGAHEFARTVDRAIHMALGRKVHNRTGLVLRQQARDQRTVADVATHEEVAGIAFERLERLQIAGIGELVEVSHRLAGRRDPVEHEIAADETCTASYQNHAFPRSFNALKITELCCGAPQAGRCDCEL